MADNKFSDEDDQAFTMQKITDMLIAAGYFRARISGLHVFDRVVGGMSWAITASGVPVEVDVNFKENANIGEKMLNNKNIDYYPCTQYQYMFITNNNPYTQTQKTVKYLNKSCKH